MMKECECMTARELLEELQKLSPEELDSPAMTEGCDCTGPAEGIYVSTNPKGEKIVVVMRQG